MLKLKQNEIAGLYAPTTQSLKDSRMSALGGGGGGGSSGGSGGGVVVGGPTPQAAMYAGLFQMKAANEASKAAGEALNNAILAVNHQYQQARYDLQPYRTEGVQAMDQLNQYLGLDPYNPGTAPTAPKVDSATINRYLNQFSDPNSLDTHTFKKADPEQVFGSLGVRYQGYIPKDVEYRNIVGPQGYGKYVGKNLPNEFAVFQNGADTGLRMYNGQPLYNGQTPQAGVWANGGSVQDLANNSYIKNWVTEALQNDPSLDATYQSSIEAYKRDLPEWQQNLDWYNQYKAAGPYDAQQVYDKISNLPGYQAELAAGGDTINKSAAAKGYLGSGRLLKELTSFGQGTLSTFYNNELDRLSGLVGQGQGAASNSGQLSSNLGNNLASLNSNYGDTRANAALASGNALAQALLASNQQYQIIGGNQGGGGGGGLGGIGSILGGIGSIASAFSSKKLKKKVKTPSTKEILKSVKELDIDTWQYHGINRTHIGPYAQDIKKKFGVGDGTKINLIDLVGILLGSTKELAKEIDTLKGVAA